MMVEVKMKMKKARMNKSPLLITKKRLISQPLFLLKITTIWVSPNRLL